MSDLYRYQPRTDKNSKLWNQLRVDRDVVPVELDYEAAEVMFKKFWDRPFGGVYSDREMTKAAVDAALRVGGETP